MPKFEELINVEGQIKRVNKYGPQEISTSIRTHPEDYTLDIERIFFDLKSSGETVRIVILREIEDKQTDSEKCEIHIPEVPVMDYKSPSVEAPTVRDESIESLPVVDSEAENTRHPLAKKRQQLALNIKKYAVQFKTTEDSLIQEIYSLYKIGSRTLLTEAQLDTEIRRYKPFREDQLREDGAI